MHKEIGAIALGFRGLLCARNRDLVCDDLGGF